MMQRSDVAFIDVPELARDLPLIVSVSGGKDSTAVALALRETGLAFQMVFADTGWEAPETYDHLNYLRRTIGPINVVRAKQTMVEAIQHRAGFPGRLQRWCTHELKVNPLKAFHNAIAADTINVVGVRSAESAARADLPVWDDDPRWGGYVWRPIIAWTVEDVLAIHHRHGIAVHPLYRRGHDRVGCFPCIFAAKGEIRLIAEHAPERIDEIRALETECTDLRARRNAEQPGRYAHAQAQFFQTRHGAQPMKIDEVVSWARTEHGGRQLPLFAAPTNGGCFRWGICDAPAEPAPQIEPAE